MEDATQDAGNRVREWASAAKPAASEIFGRPIATRIITGVAGGALLTYGIAKRDNFPKALTLLGLGLLLESITDRDLREMIAAVREYSGSA